MQRTVPPRLSLNLESLSTSPDFLLPQPVINTPIISTSTPTTPRPTIASAHVRRKTYAGDLAVATRNAIHDYEERIALLESHNSRMSVELNATRNALVDEREDRRIERQSLIMSAPSTNFSAQTGLDSLINEQSELLYERKLRLEILETLKKIRTQNMTLSQSLQESQENYASMGSVLEAEKREKEELQEEIKELSHRNFTMYEHNKLLVGRDKVLQEEISSLMTKSQADDWMRSVLEEELRKQRSKQGSPNDDACDLHDTSLSHQISAPAITLEHQGPLRAQLVAARDELHVARRCLEVSQERCEELENRVASLQRNMTQCLDSSAQALEVERELRAEIEKYSQNLEEDNTRLKDEIHDLLNSERQKDTETPSALDGVSDSLRSVVEAEESPTKAATLLDPRIPARVLCGDIQNITVEVKNVTLSPVIDNLPDADSKIKVGHRTAVRTRPLLKDQFRISSTKKIPPLFSSLSSPALVNSPLFQSMVVTPASSRRTTASMDDDYDVPSVSTHTSTQYFPSSVAENHTPTKRDSVVLKPLHLGSSIEIKSERLGLRPPLKLRPMSVIVPSPILPPVPPSTPKDRQAVRHKQKHRFRVNSADSTNHPDSPDSSSSTLVGSSTTSANIDQGKSTLMATTLSKKTSFDVGLKTNTTLFLDMHGEHVRYQLPDPIATDVGHALPSFTHMRRASKVLASIAKRTGIGLEDWFVV
ncbi:hypothetical protein GGU10DRAFT_83639 [Lentinula aff. detonsa]|uniref:Uncharacterized protein n=1 Tax=Lentinula aff. detonsa TaxID=2804958 RepID=A0AA38K8M5_9AGAR|nr:hypothetical protein GGU10DRAFT_83639 [Lentinula aff. detonsa]